MAAIPIAVASSISASSSPCVVGTVIPSSPAIGIAIFAPPPPTPPDIVFSFKSAFSVCSSVICFCCSSSLCSNTLFSAISSFQSLLESVSFSLFSLRSLSTSRRILPTCSGLIPISRCSRSRSQSLSRMLPSNCSSSNLRAYCESSMLSNQNATSLGVHSRARSGLPQSGLFSAWRSISMKYSSSSSTLCTSSAPCLRKAAVICFSKLCIADTDHSPASFTLSILEGLRECPLMFISTESCRRCSSLLLYEVIQNVIQS
mmetsp:Transcript_60707/g.96424  ORF Transcript_60707/g.96424 Transcript_60707/m.96424 type:complete len:259 (-) Transcript_60707:641-1417(-)